MKATTLRISFFLLVIFVLSLTACSAEQEAPSPVPEPTLQPTAIQENTPVISTDSPSTPVHVATPMPPREANIHLMDDNFTSADAWNTVDTGGSSVIVDDNKLTIAITKPDSYLFSLRNSPTIDNFCAEIDAQPTLCSGEDAYGLIFRSNGEASYRYALSCDGKVRFDLRKLFESPQILHDPYSSEYAPTSDSLGDVRLGICAAEGEMLFYLNGIHQFTVVDDQISAAGSIGLFAETSPESEEMLVDFYRLRLYSVRDR